MFKKIIEIIKLIKQKGFKAYLIGGSSRDLLLSNEFIDVDIATNMPLKLIYELFKVVNEDGKSLGGVKIEFKGLIVELTHFRKEKYDNNSIYPHIELTNEVEEDYVRRDFTINAIYLDLSNNTIIDPSNGLEDLKNYYIRFIGDPLVRIKEDPTRIIRALKFAKRFNFIIEENSLNAINNNLDLIKKIPLKKLEKELAKISNENTLNYVKEYIGYGK